jgi:phenylacetyl-CoA:acceptor oxidoreductase 27-kDa subunit
MTIDIEKCIGCNSCSVVCSEVHGPESNWRTVHNLGIIPESGGIRLSIPTSCMHCSDAPCVDVCPTTASYIREDGIVAIDYNKCIGCGYCILACPFDARVMSSMGKIAHNSDITNDPASEITSKCTFCSDKLDDGMKRGLIPGIDPAATPDCVNTCSARAMTFGDLNDPLSNISRLIKNNGTARINIELNTEPALYYLTPKNE